MDEPVPPADPESVARAIMLRRLTQAPRTRAELARTLRERNVPEDVSARMLDRFTELGLIDDAAYATMFAESRRQRDGWSRRAIAAKLSERGVPRDVAEQAIEAIDADDEFDTALSLGRRRWDRSSGLDPLVRRRRLAGVLARRGYSHGTVSRVLQQLGDDRDH